MIQIVQKTNRILRIVSDESISTELQIEKKLLLKGNPLL